MVEQRKYKKKEKTRLHLCEQQGHRCAICTRPIDYYADRHSEDGIGLAKLKRTEPHGQLNSVVVCVVCAAHCTKYNSLFEYYQAFQSGVVKRSKKDQVADPAIIEEINRRLISEYENLGLRPILLSERSSFRYAPAHAIPAIVDKTMRIAKIRYGRSEGLEQGRSLRSATWQKLIFQEQQDNRCYYCNTRFSHIHGHPRYATWEHVIELRKGGPNSLSNAVLACEVCNNMRDKFDMSSEEFYEWASTNGDVIEARAQELLARQKQPKPNISDRAPIQ